MSEQLDYYYEFGQYRLDPSNKQLLRDHEVVPLTPKLFEILLFLLENNGRTLSRQELLREIWSDTFVGESNLTQNIFQLRKILGVENFILTVPKNGYRFVAKVRTASKILENQSFKTNGTIIYSNNASQTTGIRAIASKMANWRVAGLLFLTFSLISTGFFLLFISKNNSVVRNSPNRSIAVLPFKQIGEKFPDEQLEIGMTDTLITKLGNLQKIVVRPTNAVIEAKQSEPIQAGRELNVDTVLSGTIQRENNRIRVNVQLVRVSDGVTIWAEKYDNSTQNIFEVQDSISNQVSLSLFSQLNEDETKQISKRYTNNLEAFEAYSRGRYFWATSSRTDLNKSIEYFQKAIKLDPNYALAYSGLADVFVFFSSNNTGTPKALESLKLAKFNAHKALEIDNKLAEPHTTLASIIFEENGDWTASEKEFLKSIELNPNYSIAHNWYSLHLLGQGDFAKAETEMKKALEIDPVSPSMNAALGQIYYFNQQYELAQTQFEKAVELDPQFARANIYLALTLVEVGKKEQAISILEQIYREYSTHTHAKTALGWLYAISGRRNEAQDILNNFNNIKTPSIYDKYGIALINAHLGNTNQALVLLEEISAFRNLNLIVRFKFDRRLDLLRKEERFIKIIQKLS